MDIANTSSSSTTTTNIINNNKIEVNNSYISCSPDLTPLYSPTKSTTPSTTTSTSTIQFTRRTSLLSDTFKSLNNNNNINNNSHIINLSGSNNNNNINIGSEVGQSNTVVENNTPTTQQPTEQMSGSFRENAIDQSDMKHLLSSQINSREKEIERLARIAERDKLDSMSYLQQINEFREILAAFLKDFYTDETNAETLERKKHIETTTTLLINLADGSHNNGSTSKSIFNSPTVSRAMGGGGEPSKELIQSMAFWEHTQTQSPSTSTSHLVVNNDAPLVETSNPEESVGNLVSSFQNKDEELERVKTRQQSLLAKSQYLKDKYNEMSTLLQSERDHWKSRIDQVRKDVESKEKDICRLLMVAETQKKASIEYIDQITKLSKQFNIDDSKKKHDYDIVAFTEMGDLSQFQNLPLSPYCEADQLQQVRPQKPKHVVAANININNSNSNITNIISPNNNINNISSSPTNINVHINETDSQNRSIQAQSSSISIPRGVVRRNSETMSPSTLAHLSRASPSSHHLHQQLVVGSPTDVINHKLQEIDRTCKCASQKDKELLKIKKIAEAERTRFAILKDKYNDLVSEIKITQQHNLACEKYLAKIS
ncbi:hypothetical protein SAMD00019534_034720, partial [Acytostelium subglobosum LB1]|uniref:hypothetical protein n=1 Tax=Acytostelium subglobosum LB1 TaxID=1410327 RepID=UPI0006450772